MQPLYPDDIWAFAQNSDNENVMELFDLLNEATEIINKAYNRSTEKDPDAEWLDDAEDYLEKLNGAL